MTDLPMTPDDVRLAAALRDLSSELAWPDAGAPGRDIASQVRAAIVAEPPTGPRTTAPSRIGWRRWRRPLILALVALLALAAIAGAAQLGLPGLRLTLGPPATTPAPSLAPPSGVAATTPGLPGVGLGLGRQAEPDEVVALTGRTVPYPTDPRIGPPDTIWVDPTRANQVALVWAPSEALPATLDPAVGLIVMAFDGSVGESFYEKAISVGTTIEPVEVGGGDGFWVSGDRHVFFYQSDDGFIDDGRRWVGDALIWSDGTRTWRIESALGRDATIEIAESIPVAAP